MKSSLIIYAVGKSSSFTNLNFWLQFTLNQHALIFHQQTFITEVNIASYNRNLSFSTGKVLFNNDLEIKFVLPGLFYLTNFMTVGHQLFYE